MVLQCRVTLECTPANHAFIIPLLGMGDSHVVPQVVWLQVFLAAFWTRAIICLKVSMHAALMYPKMTQLGISLSTLVAIITTFLDVRVDILVVSFQ